MTLWPSNWCSCHRAKPYLHMSALGCISFPLQHHRFNLLSYKSGVSWSNNGIAVSAETQCFKNPNCDTSITNINRHNSNRPPQHFQFCLLWIRFYSQYSADAQSMPACARCNLPFAWLWQPTASQACVWAHSTAQYAYLHGNLDKQNAQWNLLWIYIFASSLLPAPLSLCEQTKPQETWRRWYASNNRFFNQLLKPAPLGPFTTLNIVGCQKTLL